MGFIIEFVIKKSGEHCGGTFYYAKNEAQLYSHFLCFMGGHFKIITKRA